MHPGQLSISTETVRGLLEQQFPQWGGLPVTALDVSGTVNAVFRLGEGLVARFPLVPGGESDVGRQLRSEAQAARTLLGRTRFATPEPVGLGAPGPGYPLPWSVYTWLTGVVATVQDPGRSVAFGHDLAEFVAGVRALDTGGRSFSGAGRGGHLPDHDEWLRTCFERSERLLDVAALRRLWSRYRDLPRRGEDVMTHGDLVPGNVLVVDGRLGGVLDVGGLGPADPALDLVAAWHLLDVKPRQAFRADLECSDLEWSRGAAWAFAQAMGLVWYYRDSHPTMSRTGRRTLQRILDGESDARVR